MANEEGGNAFSMLYRFLEADEEHFDFEAATQFYADVKMEWRQEFEFVRLMDKLEERIKDHIRETGEIGAISADIKPLANRKKANIEGLEQIANTLDKYKQHGVPEWILQAIKMNILANITEYEVKPRVKLQY